MRQVVQPLGGGGVSVLDVPRPTAGATEVLVRTVASVISPGTERAVTALAQSSLLAKARARPDLARQVLAKARADGLAATVSAVRSRLAADLPLGYSAAGVAVEVGAAVSGVRPGQLVATGGAGWANHAEWQAVPGLLCAPVPEGVPAEDAALTTVAAIALHGLRLADVQPGARVVVLGLGLVGQLAVRLARAAGCEVAGIDVAPHPLRVAAASGALALAESGDATTRAVLDWSRGRGADAVLLCASGPSSAAAQRVPALCRDRARVVVVGDVGLELQRTPFYAKELTLAFARSYGPGRYERSYEEYGVDLPPGHVRWSEGRNFEAVLDLMASGRLPVADLVTHRFDVAEAPRAYDLVESRAEPYLAVQLRYPPRDPSGSDGTTETPVRIRRGGPARGRPGIGWLGAGAFSTGVLLPAFREAGLDRLVAVASASGLTARRVGERHGFERAVSGADAVIDDPDVDVVVVATPHDTHAALTVQALRAGKHVWCEKPPALTLAELDEVEAAWRESGAVLFVGYNRRWSPSVRAVRAGLASAGGPAVVTYRVNAGRLPAGHWYGDRRQGGRLLGEVCHFVDTCAALTGSPVAQVAAVAGGASELLLAESLAVVLRHADGSVAAITYGPDGDPRAPKERVEVLAGGRAVLLDDYRAVRDLADADAGRRRGRSRQDKGHRAAVAAFARAARGARDDAETTAVLASTRAVLAAAQSLGEPACSSR